MGGSSETWVRAMNLLKIIKERVYKIKALEECRIKPGKVSREKRQGEKKSGVWRSAFGEKEGKSEELEKKLKAQS